MLLTVPVELQDLILALVPRRDLAAVVRVSRHVHDVAVKFLNAHVELKSLDQVQAFFNITSTLSTGSVAATRHIGTKLSEWAQIKTLEIRLRNRKTKHTLGNLPRPLRGLRSNPIQITRLRLSNCSYDEINAIAPILSCFRSSEIGLRQTATWTRAKSVMAFPSATLASLLFACTSQYGAHPIVIRNSINLLVRMCPGLERMDLLPRHDREKETMEQTVQHGLAGKPASFFTIRDNSAGSTNVWGDVEDDA